MSELVTKFSDTGICEVDIEKVKEAWDNKFHISQWHDQYRLLQQKGCKLTISEAQALQIIESIKLLPIKSSFFRNAITWRSESNIVSEIERLEKMLKDKMYKPKKTKKDLELIPALLESIREYNDALSKKTAPDDTQAR